MPAATIGQAREANNAMIALWVVVVVLAAFVVWTNRIQAKFNTAQGKLNHLLNQQTRMGDKLLDRKIHGLDMKRQLGELRGLGESNDQPN